MGNKPAASIGKNYLYNTAYQILAVIIPLITTPYASRIFGAAGIGIQSYASSLAMVFSLFAALGVLSYGQREIAQHRDDPQETSRLFWEIELLAITTTAITCVLWLVVCFVETTYTSYLLVSGLTVLAAAFDITWFFAGLEEFRFIVLRNTAVKLIGVAFLFVAVKKESDLLLYVGVLAATGLVGNLTMFTYLRRFLVPVNRKGLRPFRHLKQTFVYFIPTIASSVYTMLDKTMLRILLDDTTENGYYEQTTRIVRIAQTLLLSINTVMSSRMSYLFSQKKLTELKQRLSQSMSFILLLGYPLTFGIMGIAKNFVPWFFGPGFEPVETLLWVYSPLLLVVGVSNCLGTQYLTPSGQRGRSSKGIVWGAAINVVLNFFFIPYFGAAGASVASVIAELVIAGVYLYMSQGYMHMKIILRHSAKRLPAAAAMLLLVMALPKLLGFGGMWMTVLQIIVGGGVYFLLLLILRDQLLLDYGGKVLKKVIHKA